MIKEHCFTREWLEDFRREKEYAKIDLRILEKMIYALHLVEQLALSQLDFVFKGGTSLALLSEQWNRFSIDIDIITVATREGIEEVLEKIIQRSHFTHYTLDEKRSFNSSVPKAHYRLSFNSSFSYSGTILLDVLFEKEFPYPETIKVPVKARWIETEEESLVTVPTIDSITGDKLTAFAPNTIGIPYYKGKLKSPAAMEIIKQLYDLGFLFDRIRQMNIVAKSYFSVAQKELEYREATAEITANDALKDAINTSIVLVRRERNKGNNKKLYAELQKGIKAFGSGYLVSGKFRIDEAIVASGKVALLAGLILSQNYTQLQKYSEEIKQEILEDPEWNFLNKLLKINKEGFHYWKQAYSLFRLLF